MRVRKILAYALGPIGGAAFSLISLPLVSWYFTAEDIGRVVLLQTLSGLGILVLGLGLDQAYIREYHASSDPYTLFKTVFLPPLLLTLVLALFAGTYADTELAQLLFDNTNPQTAWLALAFIGSVLLSRFFSLILRMQEHALAFSFSQLLPKCLILLALLPVALGMVHHDLRLLPAIYTFAQLLTLALLLIQTRSTWTTALNRPYRQTTLQNCLRYGIPLTLANLAYWGFTSIDRFMLKSLAGLQELGVYSMAVSFSAVALIFQSIFSTVWSPMVFKWVAEKQNLDRIGHIALHMTALMSAIISLIGLGSPLLMWILPPQYSEVPYIVLSAMLVPLLYTLTEVSGIGLNVMRKTTWIALISCTALACNTALLYWLVPLLGAGGAAVATAVSFALFFVLKTECSSAVWQALPRLKMYAVLGVQLGVSLAYTLYGRTHYPLFALIWLTVLITLLIRYRYILHTVICRLKKY